MRTAFIMVLIFSATVLRAQTSSSQNLLLDSKLPATNNIQPVKEVSPKKWSFSRYNAISTSMAFFKGGNATIISAPIGLQVNRRLANNWYAFANVAVAPAYTNFNQSFLGASYNKFGQKNGSYNSK